MEGGTTYHVCLDISGALKMTNKSLDGILSEGGRKLTGSEVKRYLIEVRAKHGYTHYSGCNNMNEQGRCAGHPTNNAPKGAGGEER